MPAAWLIFFATIFDGLDGKVARSLGGGSQFGLEFDSLADLVSFGVAPGLLFYLTSLRGFGGIFGAVAACFFVLCVALRLARFNVIHVPSPFQGLPSPAGGLFAASFVLAEIRNILSWYMPSGKRRKNSRQFAQKRALSRCIGRTKGGLNSKLHALKKNNICYQK